MLTMAGKSAAKIRRNIARAAARGESYTPPEPPAKTEEDGDSEDTQTKLKAAQKLTDAVSTLESNPDNINAKERRSAKRKAEAIATEESGCKDVDELLNWYKKHKPKPSKSKKQSSSNKQQQQNAIIEQLSEEDKAKLASVKKLHISLENLEKDDTLNAKERRSAKRKAEAIAAEETGGTPRPQRNY